MTTTHIMVDLETWGTAPGCDIRSIGAVVFDPVAGTLGDEFYVNVENPAGRWRDGEFFPALADGTEDYRHYQLTRDPSTVDWWSKQSEAAQQRLTTDVVDLRDGLLQFGRWWHARDPYQRDAVAAPATFWAHGPHFDEAILAACYRAVGLLAPWHYRAPRDCRTVFDLTNDPCHVEFEGVEHDALADAKNQALRVIEGYRRIRNPIVTRQPRYQVWQEPVAGKRLHKLHPIGEPTTDFEAAQETAYFEDLDEPAPDKHDFRRIVIRSIAQ